MTKQCTFDAILSTCVTLEDGKSLISFFDFYGEYYLIPIIKIFPEEKMFLGCRKTRIHYIQDSTNTKKREATKEERKHITKLIRTSTKI